MKTLDADQLAALDHDLHLWRCEGDTALLRDLVFADFKAAFAFMTEVCPRIDPTRHRSGAFDRCRGRPARRQVEHGFPNALAFGKGDGPPELMRGARAALERTKMNSYLRNA